MKRIFIALIILFSTSTICANTCGIVYVDAAVVVSGNGTSDMPFKTLSEALAPNIHVKLALGTYNEIGSILNLQDNIIIEGGYTNNAGQWSKTSSNTSTINCGRNEYINNEIEHIVGLKSDGVSNWKLIDLSINSIDATNRTFSGKGKSNYTIWINNSNNYKIVRCQISSGIATDGASGISGENGDNGKNGSNGGAGQCDHTTTNASGGGGGAGGSAVGSNLRKGGSGGSGGSGGWGGWGNNGSNGNSGIKGENGGGGNTAASAGSGGGKNGRSTCWGGNTKAGDGNNGGNGSDGNNGSPSYGIGIRPTTNTNFTNFFIPNDAAVKGGDGAGGAGGSGGGGGGGSGGIGACADADGGWGGSGGGSGGEGGAGGFGGLGGGASFAVYANNSNGNILSSSLNAGNPGFGGSGGIGGSGGNGGSGGARRVPNCGGADGGDGGAGGNGGKGGTGGRGQDGANGISHGFFEVGIGGAIVNNYANSNIITINYNNNQLCSNSIIELNKNSSSNWNLSNDFNFVNNVNSSTSTYSVTDNLIQIYTSQNNIDGEISVGSQNFNDYLLVKENRTLPIIENVETLYLCQFENKEFVATNWGTEINYKWELYAGNSSSAVPIITGTNHNFNYTFNNVGSFILKYQVEESCCSWSIPVYQKIEVRSGDNNIQLANSSKTNLVEQCEIGSWTYYADSSNQNQWLFAINKNGNNFTASVDIEKYPTTISSINSLNQHAAFIVGRTWNVNIKSGVLNPLQPVSIRFFVDTMEINNAKTLAETYANTFGLNVSDLEFFKHPSLAFNPVDQVSDGNNFNFNKIILNANSGIQNQVTYYELDNITSFSGGGAAFTVSENASTLPVELINFEAKSIENKYIQLDWSTATEINNEGFEIERSINGVEFTKIDFVNGNGNSTIINNYQFEDKGVNKNITYYYRLKQVDYDGEFEYSEIVSAQLEGKDKFSVGDFRPNPTKENTLTTVTIISTKEETIKVSAYNSIGVNVLNLTQQLEEGSNEVVISTENLSSGTYFINFEGNFSRETKRLIVVK